MSRTSFVLSFDVLCSLSFEGTIKTIAKYDGLRGFYRGLGPTILGYLPTWAIYFAVYDGIKSAFGEAPLGVNSKSKNWIYPAAQVKGYQPAMREHPWSLHILSAMTAGACSTICTNPLWVIKTRFMVRRLSFVRFLSHIRSTDAIPGRSALSTYSRCRTHYISQRRHSRLLPRTLTKSPRHRSCSSTISTLRAT